MNQNIVLRCWSPFTTCLAGDWFRDNRTLCLSKQAIYPPSFGLLQNWRSVCRRARLASTESLENRLGAEKLPIRASRVFLLKFSQHVAAVVMQKNHFDFPSFWIFSTACKRGETHNGETFNFFANPESIWHGFSSSNAGSSAFSSCLSSPRSSHHFGSVKIIPCMVFFHHKFQIVCDALHMQFFLYQSSG